MIYTSVEGNRRREQAPEGTDQEVRSNSERSIQQRQFEEARQEIVKIVLWLEEAGGRSNLRQGIGSIGNKPGVFLISLQKEATNRS